MTLWCKTRRSYSTARRSIHTSADFFLSVAHIFLCLCFNCDLRGFLRSLNMALGEHGGGRR